MKNICIKILIYFLLFVIITQCTENDNETIFELIGTWELYEFNHKDLINDSVSTYTKLDWEYDTKCSFSNTMTQRTFLIPPEDVEEYRNIVFVDKYKFKLDSLIRIPYQLLMMNDVVKNWNPADGYYHPNPYFSNDTTVAEIVFIDKNTFVESRRIKGDNRDIILEHKWQRLTNYFSSLENEIF